MTNPRKPPTIERRVARVMASVVQGDRDAYIRTLIWRELRAAVRDERKACARACEDWAEINRFMAASERREAVRHRYEDMAWGAAGGADRIRMRRGPR